MVMSSNATKKVYIWEKINDNDLRLFLAYMQDLTISLGISEYKALKDAGIQRNYLTGIRRILAGKKQYRKNIYLHTLIHLSLIHNFPFNMDKYKHILEAYKLPDEPKKG